MSSLEDLFGKIALTTVTTVSRIALSHATNAAIRNVTSYITTQLPKNKPDTREIRTLQRQLDLKVKNLKPTIDIIARSVADGNTDLEPALEMCNDLKSDIDDFAAKPMTNPDQVKSHLKQLLQNVDDAIPSLHLSLRSIENKTGTPAISPAKLIQASNILRGQDAVFCVKLYSLFAANQREASADAFTWKEEFHKASLVVQAQKDIKYNYELVITEDTNDGRYHDEGEQLRKVLDVSHIERMYYTQSGELLNIEDSKSPVLVMKVAKRKGEDKDSVVEIKESAPEIIKEELQTSDWYAVGLWSANDDEDDDDDSDSSDEEEGGEKKDSTSASNSSSKLLTSNNHLNLLQLESVIKLAMLEITERMSHINASDELITLYMK